MTRLLLGQARENASGGDGGRNPEGKAGLQIGGYVGPSFGLRLRVSFRLTLGLILMMGLWLTGCSKSKHEVICYNCASNWGGWHAIFARFVLRTGVSIPSDNRNTGQAIASALAERAHPIADVFYLGGQGGIQASRLGLTARYEPPGFDQIPPGLRDPGGRWFAVHTGTIGFFVNVAALDGAPVPQSWKDLLDPRYRGMIGYFDPSAASAGYVTAMAVNLAMGGTYTHIDPGLAYLKALQRNAPILLRQTAYARVLSGEIPIMLDYDFNAYRARYRDEAPVRFIIPLEGSASFPYVMALQAGAPHEADAKHFLDFLLSSEGQALWARAYMRPIREEALPASIAARFLPLQAYARAPALDLAAMAGGQAEFARRFASEVRE